MEKKILYGIMPALLAMSIVMTTLPIDASPVTVLSVQPTSIIDPPLVQGSIFRINITVADVRWLMLYEFNLSYNTGVLTATDFGIYLPFKDILPMSAIDDNVGNVYLAAYTEMGDPVGLHTVDPKPIAWIEFIVDDYGDSVLDLHDSRLGDVYGVPIAHNTVDGYFSNQPAVTEFPLGVALCIAALPLLFYIRWKRKQKVLQ